MKFRPLTETELETLLLLPEGIYQFKVEEATDEISKSSGKEMIKLKLKVDDGINAPRFIYDYLVEAMQFKLHHFAKCTDLLEKYERGELTCIDCIGKTGDVEIIIQPGSDKPTGGSYPAKNTVKDYITSFVPHEVRDNAKPFINDDLPF